MRKPLDILLGTKAPTKPEQTPMEKTRAKIYEPNPIVKIVKQNQDKAKSTAEAAYNAELKRKANAVKDVAVKTKYGTATVPQKGYESYTLAQKTAWLKQTAKEIEDTVDAQQKADGGTVVAPNPSPYDPGKPVTEGDFYTAAANAALGTQQGMQVANTVAATDTGKAIASGARDVSKVLTVKNDDPFAQFMLDLTVNAPAGIATNIGNIFDVNVDNLGKLQSVAELQATAIPTGQSARAGKAVFNASREAGVPLIKSLAKGAGAAAMENIGIGSLVASGLAENLVKAGRRGIDALPIPAGIRERLIPRTNELPFTPKPALMERNPVAPGQTPVAQVADVAPTPPTSFADQQRAMLRDVLGADDVSGVVPEPMVAVKPKPDAVVAESATTPYYHGTGNVGSIREKGFSYDFAGKGNDQYGPGFYFTNDAEVANGYTTRQLSGMEKPGGELDPGVVEVDISLKNPIRMSSESDYSYNNWKPLSKSQLKTFVNYMTETMSDDALADFGDVYSLGRNRVIKDMVEMFDGVSPGQVVYDLGERGGGIERGMRKYSELSGYDGVEITYPNGEVHTVAWFPEQVKVRPPKIEPDAQPLQPQPTAAEPPTPVDMAPTPKMADMTPREPSVPTVTATADAPQNVTGISNAANLSDFEQGILSSAPEGKGRSVKEIYETNRNRKDYDNVADRVSKGEALTADNAAVILAGKAEYTAKVRSAKGAIEQGIVDGVSDADMAGRRKALDDAIESATEYAEKIQRGKSEWSDVGRTLAAYLDVDTRDIASVLQESRIRKGSALTAEEIAKREAEVKALTDLLDESKAEIARLMKAHADNATKVAAARKIVKTPEARAAKRKQALDEFFAASSGLNAYVNPKVIKQFAKYMYTLIEDGARSVDDIVAAAAKDGVKADYEDVYAAMRSQVKESTLSDLQKEIAKTKRELRKEAEAAIPGNQAVKDFRKAERADAPGNEAVKDFKATARSKKSLEEKLKGLEERIANKDYAEVSIVKNARRTDDELDLLRQKIRVKESMVKAGIEAMRPRSRAEKVGNFLNEIKLLNPASRLKDFAANSVKGADFVASSILRRGVDWTTSKILGELPITKGTNVDRTQRVLAKAKNRMIADAELIAKGADPDSIKKYGSYKGIGGKAAGLTDVPFKSFYYEWMQDAAADYKARKTLGKGATPEAIATKREEILANIDEHPDIQLMAEEYSLNQTFNNSNWASRLVASAKREVNGAGKVAVDEFIGRFAKVITNVATDATDRTGIGILRGGKKLIDAKMLGQSLSVSERAIINDMITKGATGMAALSLGYFLGDKIPGTIKGERGKYVDFGDLESIGGPISPFLLGAIYKKAESIDDPEQAAGLRLASVLRLPINTPLASNSKDLLNALSDSSSTQGIKKLLARKISNVFIPGGVRDIAERMDSKGGILTGSEVEREKIPKEINPKTKKEVQTKNFLEILKSDVKSKIPFWRQQLPIKKTDEQKKADKKKESEAKKLKLLK